MTYKMRRKFIDMGLSHWKNLRRGSQLALYELYNVYYEDLYFYGMKIRDDDALIRDIIQDIFIDLWTNQTKLPEISAVRPYILRMMRNKAIDEIKKHDQKVGGNDNIVFERLVDFQYSPEEIILSVEAEREQGLQITKALNALPTRQREIIQLRFFSRCSYEEIFEITGVNYQSARNTVSKALKNLRNSIQENISSRT
jgi:RNA polymerase sigma factor (sigma-70 family)